MGLISSKVDKSKFRMERIELGDDDYAYARELTEGELDKAMASKQSDVDFIARLVLYSACDEEGNNLFKSISDVQALPYRWVDAIGSKVIDLNKQTIDEIESAAKN